jgi:hypothetical protein
VPYLSDIDRLGCRICRFFPRSLSMSNGDLTCTHFSGVASDKERKKERQKESERWISGNRSYGKIANIGPDNEVKRNMFASEKKR